MRDVEFELEIVPAGESYQATVLRSPLDRQSRRARCMFSLPDPEDPGPALLDPRHLALVGSRPPGGSDQELGHRLFESVFIGKVLTAWQASLAVAPRALTLRLRLAEDPRLLSVPWELLFDTNEGEFIATERCLIRSVDVHPEARHLKAKAQLRVLCILACPADVTPLQIEEEWTVLREALGGAAELTRIPPRLDEVDRALRSGKWDVLHFVGHGEVDDEGGYLILEEWQGDARAVDHLRVGTFLAHPSLQMVVLNTCSGGRTGAGDAFSGVAQALVKRGVPAVVAMQQPISDRTAIAFTRSFYTALAEKIRRKRQWQAPRGRLTVAQALRRARRTLFCAPEAEWAIPVLYLNGPDGPLVKDRSIWWFFAAVLGGLLLLGLTVWHWSHMPPSLIPPRGEEENPGECPSPPGLNMAFVRIKPGTFRMGEKGNQETEPVHQVTITRPFCIGVYEVTQEQVAILHKQDRPPLKRRHLPVSGLKYEAALELVRLINESDPTRLYRLPREAEWEYVAHGKTGIPLSLLADGTPLDHLANCGRGDEGGPAWVGQFPANPWGVHDMFGNVAEWVEDWGGSYSGEPVQDPQGPEHGARRIRRGGSWSSSLKTCLSPTARSLVVPTRSNKDVGLRIVQEIP